MEMLNKMIETLAKLAKEGRDSELTRRLSRNLGELRFFLNAKKFDVSFLSPVFAKQSLSSAVEVSAKLLAESEKVQFKKNLATANNDSEFNTDFCGN